jgi:nitrogenase molybdenum-iron protein alpha/beta subunit
VSLQDELDRIAASAQELADVGEEVTGVLAADTPAGGRVYLCAFSGPEGISWLALDEQGEPVTRREVVRGAASLIALCEVAEESAGGGELDDLLARLVALRLTENPIGIEEAEEAVRELQRVLGATPRLASAAFLDEVGTATRRLEAALGESSGGSPFAELMKQGAASVEEFTTDVESNYRGELL